MKLFKLLSSYKLSIVIIIAIAVTALIGSFIPDTSIYSSPLFIVLLIIFSINLILCTIKLFPFAKRGYSDIDAAKLTENMGQGLAQDDVLKKIAAAGWKLSKIDDTYRAEKHAIGRYGVIILHAGIIIVLAGALLGRVSGFNAAMSILEGTNDDVAVLPSGDTIPLGFNVYLDDFEVEYYEKSAHAKSYKSIITVTDRNGDNITAEVDVNHPFKYKGVVFYQTTFGFYPNRSAMISLSSGDEKYRVNIDEEFTLPNGYIAKAVDFAPSLAKDDEGRLISVSEELLNPAVLIEVYDSKKPVLRGWVLKNSRKSGDFSDIGFNISFDDIYGVQYSGFSVKKDIGTFVVYIGFIFISFGIIFIYLLNYTAVFFKMEGGGVLAYAVKQQRKHPLFAPADGFRKLFS